MVRVLGHRCSIVVWNFWSPYFRVKAAWLKFSSFECSITFSRHRVDYRRSLDCTITVGWQPSALWNDTITVDYCLASSWCLLEPSFQRLPKMFVIYALSFTAMHSMEINCSQQLDSWVDNSFGTNWSPINDYLYRYHGREFWRSLMITQLVRNMRGEIVINLDQHGILPWLWALSYMRARRDSHLYRQLPIVLYLPW